MTFTAVYTRAPEEDYTVTVKEIPGALSEGASIEEARENLVDALRMVLECHWEIARKEGSPSAVREEFALAAL